MDEWISKLICNGHTLQFVSPPPRFNGMMETMLPSMEQSDALQSCGDSPQAPAQGREEDTVKESLIHTAELACHLSRLGFAINWEKSSPFSFPNHHISGSGFGLPQQRTVTAAESHPSEPSDGYFSHVARVMSAASRSPSQFASHEETAVLVFSLAYRLYPPATENDLCSPLGGSGLMLLEESQTLSTGVLLGRVTSHISVFTDTSLSPSQKDNSGLHQSLPGLSATVLGSHTTALHLGASHSLSVERRGRRGGDQLKENGACTRRCCPRFGPGLARPRWTCLPLAEMRNAHSGFP